MPINMITEQKYDIDYQKMRNELMELNIFHDKNIQQKYVSMWIGELMNADSISVNSYFDSQNRELLLKEKLVWCVEESLQIQKIKRDYVQNIKNNVII